MYLVKKIVLDMQSTLYARYMERALVQDLPGWQPIISESPDMTAELCNMHQPKVLLMEVTAYAPWIISERLSISSMVKDENPSCKIFFSVEERADKHVVKAVKEAKRKGLIDEFVFLSMSDKYLPALLDTL